MVIETIGWLVLILLGLFLAYWLGHKLGAHQKHKEWEGEIEYHRKDAVMRSRSVLSGQFSENLAPYLPNFPFSPTECRFVGKPVDFIVFNGMDEKKINGVTFVEVKSGESKLSNQEKNLKEAIEKGNISFYEYRVDKGVTSHNL